MKKKRLIEAIRSSRNILITAHINPDLDAICSQLALSEYLRQIGKRATLLNNDEVPERYSFIGGLARIKKSPARIRKAFDLVIVLDCGDLNRTGQVQNLISSKTQIVNIDHHVSNDGFGHINCVDTRSSSTGEVIYDLFSGKPFTLTRKIAIYLYVAIMTDTGSFRYSNTSAKTHRIVSELMRFDIPNDKLYEQIYESIPFEDFFQFAKIIGKLKQFYGGRVICFEFDKKLQERFSLDFDLRETTLNFLKQVKGVELIIIFSYMESQRTRVNFRSTHDVNVAKLAGRFNGGGHKRASGCVISRGIKAAQKTVLDEIDKIFKVKR